MKMNQQDLGALAKNIIDTNIYMVLGTADESGQPWVTPVYFAHKDYREFYWISSPEVRHSRNIAMRPQVSIVIFDSQVAVGKGQAVYMSTVAEELTGVDFGRGLDIYNGRFSNPAEHGVQVIMKEDLQASGLYRLYRAVASEHWVLDPAGRPDHRTPVTL
jgi:Pyridoxamine 5'-phosphate oxidase